MNDKEKALAKSQSNLMDVIGCGRTQAWRIWTGRSALTKSNKRLLEAYENESVTTKQRECKRDI